MDCTSLGFRLDHHYVVEWLVNRGANVEAKSNAGDTPLMVASQYDSINSAVFLTARDVD